MSDDLIAEGRALLEAATAGPWVVHDLGDDEYTTTNKNGWWWVWQESKLPYYGGVLEVTRQNAGDDDPPGHPVGIASITDGDDGQAERADAELIVWMRNNLSVILDELEEARAAYRKLHADTQEGWARIAARQQRDAQRIRDLEQQLAGGGAS